MSLRVGALPQFPTNALKYNLTWSTDGLINEYCSPCKAIVDGELREVPPLEGLEVFVLDGVAYEAFNTSGGLGTLSESFLGRVEDLSYQSVRYPGHCEIVKLLVRDLRLARPTWSGRRSCRRPGSSGRSSARSKSFWQTGLGRSTCKARR